MDAGSRSLGDIGIGVGFVAAAIVMALLGDPGDSLVFGFGAVGAIVLIYGIVRRFTSRRSGSANNRP